MAAAHNAQMAYVKLEQRLLLLAWLNNQFGYANNADMLADMKQTGEGFDAVGSSYIYYLLAARGSRVKVPLQSLAAYDNNIRTHLAAMNARRPEPIRLRYFQHLTALYTEVFLDACFHHPAELLRRLNTFVADRNAGQPPGTLRETHFTQSDLKKLAYWMATGSGKTLIMHLNYRQFLHYNDQPLDNILLITPNEGLSRQHMEEMAASGIPCRRFDLNESGLSMAGRDVVRVIEITKLVQEKRGGGQSVPVEAFEGNNLIFVDEGHKGSGGLAWRSFRDALAETGFTFEYSATFGQALTAARNDALTAEYGKAIIFDYSYRYFHDDGYGKDFRILNLRDEPPPETTETLMLGNLLSFYEQQCVFAEDGEALRPYQLEKPLWVFVGSSVNAVYTENRQKRSDVLTVARFLHHLLENKDDWVVTGIRRLLDGQTGLVDANDQDIFLDKFPRLRAMGDDARQIYRGILFRLLHTTTGGGLHLCDIRAGAGELALRASGADQYFGLIYIGDTPSFKKLVEADDVGIVSEEDAITPSLFEGINEPDTNIEVLIGAKKFMEGWNSWRVSNMGLLNIGKQEGSEIIQLFGRGVRLRGRHFSLKRSSALDGMHPRHIGLLETLNIFAVRANYMAQFREYLEREGVPAEGEVVLPLAIRPNQDFLDQGLLVPRLPEDRSFVNEVSFLLEPDKEVRVMVDMSLHVQVVVSTADGLAVAKGQAGQQRAIPDASLALVDWEAVYLALLEYKQRKGLTNLIIQPGTPRRIMETRDPVRLYTLIADEPVVQPRSFADTRLLQEAVLSILRKYVDTYYRRQKERWESEHMVYKVLDDTDPNFQDYTVKIPRGEGQLVAAVSTLIEEGERIYHEDTCDLPSIHFDRHLYQPLLVSRGGAVKSEPPGLNDSERRFVEDMRLYCRSEKGTSLRHKDVYLLRNLSRGKGIGFFANRGFYPDFILWIKDGQKQRIVFIEPHGMLHAGPYQHDDKARLHEALPSLGSQLAERAELMNVSLDSFIVSATPFEELRPRYDDGNWDRRRFSQAHILFPERTQEYDYLPIVFAVV